MSKRKFYTRKFLNAKEGTAFVEAKISRSSDGSWVDASVKLADCHRMITLDFDHHDQKSHAAVVDKVTLLIEVLDRFRSSLLERSS